MLKQCLLFIFLIVPTVAFAKEGKERTQLRLTMHKDLELTQETELSFKFVLVDDLNRRQEPIVILGIKKHLTTYVSTEISVGWTGIKNEPLIELSFLTQGTSFWGTFTSEVRTKTLHGYWFIQGEYPIHGSLFCVGMENESWGSYVHGSSWMIQTGPNLVFRTKTFEVDLAVHLSRSLRPEIVSRIYFFF